SKKASGACVVYRGVDPFQPIEAFAPQLTAGSATQNIGSVSTSLGGEEVVLLLAGAASGTYTPASGYIAATRKQQADSTIEIQHRQVVNPGIINAFTETFSSAVDGASLALVLSPSYGLRSYADAYQRLFEALPRGIDNVLDFSTTGD